MVLGCCVIQSLPQSLLPVPGVPLAGIHNGPPVRALEVGGRSPSMLLIFDVMRGSTQCTHVLYLGALSGQWEHVFIFWVLGENAPKNIIAQSKHAFDVWHASCPGSFGRTQEKTKRKPFGVFSSISPPFFLPVYSGRVVNTGDCHSGPGLFILWGPEDIQSHCSVFTDHLQRGSRPP